MAFLRLSCGTPGKLHLLQRALGKWQTAMGVFESRELRKAGVLAAERARNLKKGWKDERELRLEMETRATAAEAEAKEAVRASRASEAALASAASNPPHASASMLPKPGGGAAGSSTRPGSTPAPSQLPPPPPPPPRLKELEQRAAAASEEAARAIESARADKRALANLHKEHATVLTELKGLRKGHRHVGGLEERLVTLRDALRDASDERAALRLRLLAATADRPEVHALRTSCLALRLSKARLAASLASAKGALHGERWRGAAATWRFCERARLARGLARWCESVHALEVLAECEARVVELEERGEFDGRQNEATQQAALERLRKSADSKLRKERQLATTRLMEREALERQVKQLQAQLRHASALQHQPSGQDTAVPTSSTKPGAAWTSPRGASRPRGTSGSGPTDGRDGKAGAAAEGERGARRPPLPKRAAITTLADEELRELREALADSRHERDVLRGELDAMRLELDTTRELLDG